MRHRAWLIAIAALIVIVGFIVHRKAAPPDRGSASVAASKGTPATGSSPSTPPPGGSAAPGRPAGPDHVTRFATPAERQAVADRIAAARATRVAQTPKPPPSLPGEPAPEDSHDLERVGAKLKQALGEAIPFLAECYATGSAKPRTAAVKLTLTADPEIGTLIGADQLLDEAGSPLDPELDSCLRTTLSSLQLPPIDASRDLHITYSFRFDD